MWLWIEAVVRLVLRVVIWLNALVRRARGIVRKLPVLRGQPPSPPRVLGIVVAEKHEPLREGEREAIARIITWAVANGFTLLTLYSPTNPLTVRAVQKLLESFGGDHNVNVWSGWNAPREWIGAMRPEECNKESYKAPRSQPLGVALLGPADAEGPLALLGDASVPAFTSSPACLERALRAPEELRRVMGRFDVGGPVAQLDTDMIMIFGDISSLFGYPAWTTRSSEIYSMGDLVAVENDRLSATLQRYRMTRKRQGR